MKLKTLAAASAIAFSSLAANAAYTDTVMVVGGSTFDELLGSITLPASSIVSGGLDYLVSMSFGRRGEKFLPEVTLDRVSLGSHTNAIGAGNTFTFSGLAAGNYDLRATGRVAVGAAGVNYNFLQGEYNITAASPVSPVPEPESYAMLLAGLGVMGAIARRRNKADSAA